ncbi:hypothetical protein PENNAL_c0009G01903, partial [Penicillium nalgiovense]
MELGVEDDGY